MKMVHKDGVKAEKFFQKFCKEKGIQCRMCHRPFDFIINERTYVEVKSAKILTRYDNKRNIYGQGRYECWNKSQLRKIKDSKCYICLIMQYDGNLMIQGFIRAIDYPNKRKISINVAESLKKLSKKQFIRRFKR